MRCESETAVVRIAGRPVRAAPPVVRSHRRDMYFQPLGLLEVAHQDRLGALDSELAEAMPSPIVFPRTRPSPGAVAPDEARANFGLSLGAAW